MPTLSVVILTHNSEKLIRPCLESVKWADGIIIVDSMSQDKTLDICREYTDKIWQRPWPGYSDQRNFALEQAGGDWIFFLDSDEQVSLPLQDEIRCILSRSDPSCKGYLVPRKSFFLGRWIRGAGWYPCHVLRLIRKGAGRYNDKAVHESIEIDGEIGHMKGNILHFSYESIDQYMRRLNRYTDLEVRNMCRDDSAVSGRKAARRALTGPLKAFFKKYLKQGGFRDGMHGFILCVFSAFYVFMTCAKYWERNIAKGGK